jgi:hypothetical protein
MRSLLITVACLCCYSPVLAQSELPPPPAHSSPTAASVPIMAATNGPVAVYRCQGGVCSWETAASTVHAAPLRIRVVERSVLVTRRVLSAPRRVFAGRPVRRALGTVLRPFRGRCN